MATNVNGKTVEFEVHDIEPRFGLQLQRSTATVDGQRSTKLIRNYTVYKQILNNIFCVQVE